MNLRFEGGKKLEADFTFELKKNKVINVLPKCVCLGKSLMVNFLSSSKKKKVHINYIPTNT